MNSLERIKKWVHSYSKQTLEHLNSPATEEEIKISEKEIGVDFPDDFKTFLRLHDGEDGDGWLALLGNGNQLLPCKYLVQQYKLDQEIGKDLFDPEMETIEFWKDRVQGDVILLKGAVKPLTLHPKWVPFTCMNGDVFRYFDFDPAPGGIAGQIIEVDPENCSYEVIANSFSELLEQYASELEEGKYSVDEEGYIESKGEKEYNWGAPDWLKNA